MLRFLEKKRHVPIHTDNSVRFRHSQILDHPRQLSHSASSFSLLSDCGARHINDDDICQSLSEWPIPGSRIGNRSFEHR